MTALRVLVADDEPPARARIRAMLAGHADAVIVGEAENGREAVDAILRESPDVVFLDIRMPELDGFEVLDLVRETEGNVPAIVFVTAYDAHALAAFEAGAVDYLLKPFDQERFDRTLRNAMERVVARRLLGDAAASALAPAVDSLLRSMRHAPEYAARLLVRRGRQMQFVRTEEVEWFEAQGNYVRLHVDGRAHLLRETMTGLEARLDPAVFIRVHRSAIVNIDRVAHMEPYVHGEITITMRGGSRLTTSAGHGARFRQLLR